MIGRIADRICCFGALPADVRRGARAGRSGIEICTVEKTMERRTSCLQSNVDFLQKTINKLGADHQQKLDAANRQIEGLKGTVAGLQKTVDEMQAAQKKAMEDLRRRGTQRRRKDGRASRLFPPSLRDGKRRGEIQELQSDQDCFTLKHVIGRTSNNERSVRLALVA